VIIIEAHTGQEHFDHENANAGENLHHDGRFPSILAKRTAIERQRLSAECSAYSAGRKTAVNTPSDSLDGHRRAETAGWP